MSLSKKRIYYVDSSKSLTFTILFTCSCNTTLMSMLLLFVMMYRKLLTNCFAWISLTFYLKYIFSLDCKLTRLVRLTRTRVCLLIIFSSCRCRGDKTWQVLVQRKYIFQIKCQRNSDKTVCEPLSVNHHHEQE